MTAHPFAPRLRFSTHEWHSWWQSRLLILRVGDLRAVCPIDWDIDHSPRRCWYLAERHGFDWWSTPRRASASETVSLQAAKRWLQDPANHKRVQELNAGIIKRLQTKVAAGNTDLHTRDFLNRMEAEYGVG